MNEVEFLQKLREAFAIEAEEHFRTMSKCLSDLEDTRTDGRGGVVELIFREAHSLKGAARAINRGDIEMLCQSMESLFAIWKKDPATVTHERIDLTAQAVDLLGEMLGQDRELSPNDATLTALTDRLKQECAAAVTLPAAVAGQGKEHADTSPGNGTVAASSAMPAAGLPGNGGRSSMRVPHPDIRIEDMLAELLAPKHAGAPSAGPTTPATALPLPSEARKPENGKPENEKPENEKPENGKPERGNPEGATPVGFVPGAASAPASEIGGEMRPSVERAAGEKDSSALVGAGSALRSVKDTIRVPIAELEALYRQTEELSAIKFMMGRHGADLRRVIDQCREWIREYHQQRQSALEDYEVSTGRVKDADFHAAQQEKVQNFLKWTARQIEGIETAVGKNIEDGRSTLYIMESMSESMMENAKQLLLLPFTLLTDPLPSMVRKLARDLKKDIRFQITGEEVRIDKRILEALKDPIMHLLRNSLDHGIEDAVQRARLGKELTGQIGLTIRTAADSRIEVLLEDDGRGIDIERVKRKAIEEGCITEEKARKLSDHDALELVFEAGVTTSPIITDLSGRGIGLNVVRENIVALGGEIEIETETGRGTRFRISLPLSLSNARGVLVRSQGRLYVVPLQFVERGLSIHRENFTQLDGKTVTEYHGRTVTVRRLDEILSGNSTIRRDERPQATVLLLRLSANLIAVEVDEILWEQDVVIKPLPAPVGRVRTVAGATMLSTGELVLVLQVPDLFEAARKVSSSGRGEQPKAGEKTPPRLLVVDDSITSRVLLHDILVSSGYDVKTAVDGIDALTHLREAPFDLIVSDVEMPRMNGFELTESVRKDERMSALPVILVTGLESPEDRERGFDVGANAYITKSSFDQSNLITVIERLV